MDVLSVLYIYVFYCDMFNVVNVYLDHLKFCVVCINGRRYVCCGECYVVSNECDEHLLAPNGYSLRVVGVPQSRGTV